MYEYISQTEVFLFIPFEKQEKETLPQLMPSKKRLEQRELHKQPK